MMNQYRDVESLNAFQELKRKGYSEDYILKILDQNREIIHTHLCNGRMEASGFTSGQPWIDIAPNYKEVNVEQAIEDDHSVFHMYRRLIDLRHNHDILTYGDITPLYMTHDQLFIYRRNYQSKSWL